MCLVLKHRSPTIGAENSLSPSILSLHWPQQLAAHIWEMLLSTMLKTFTYGPTGGEGTLWCLLCPPSCEKVVAQGQWLPNAPEKG